MKFEYGSSGTSTIEIIDEDEDNCGLGADALLALPDDHRLFLVHFSDDEDGGMSTGTVCALDPSDLIDCDRLAQEQQIGFERSMKMYAATIVTRRFYKGPPPESAKIELVVEISRRELREMMDLRDAAFSPGNAS